MESAKPYVDAAKQRIPPRMYEQWGRANGILQEFITMYAHVQRAASTQATRD